MLVCVRGGCMKWRLLSGFSLFFYHALPLFILSITLLSPAAAQPQAGSAENPRDCKGIDFGPNKDFGAGGCCLPSENLGCGCGKPAPVCGKCGYTMTPCEQRLGCGTTATDGGCGCGNPAPVCGKCGYKMTPCEQRLGCGTTATDRGCGCGNPAPGACGCTACPPPQQPPPPSCNHAPVHLWHRYDISFHFGMGSNDSNGVLNDTPMYYDICKSALGASSTAAVVPYEIHTAQFRSPGNNAICAYMPNSSTQKHCVNAQSVGNPAHIAQIKCRCK
jgi:hypothetical protein